MSLLELGVCHRVVRDGLLPCVDSLLSRTTGWRLHMENEAQCVPKSCISMQTSMAGICHVSDTRPKRLRACWKPSRFQMCSSHPSPYRLRRIHDVEAARQLSRPGFINTLRQSAILDIPHDATATSFFLCATRPDVAGTYGRHVDTALRSRSPARLERQHFDYMWRSGPWCDGLMERASRALGSGRQMGRARLRPS
jgi:hypothetical protein